MRHIVKPVHQICNLHFTCSSCLFFSLFNDKMPWRCMTVINCLAWYKYCKTGQLLSKAFSKHVWKNSCSFCEDLVGWGEEWVLRETTNLWETRDYKRRYVRTIKRSALHGLIPYKCIIACSPSALFIVGGMPLLWAISILSTSFL